MDPSSQAASVEPVVLSRNQLLLVLALFPAAFVLFGLSVDSPAAIFRGLVAILTSQGHADHRLHRPGRHGRGVRQRRPADAAGDAIYWRSGAVIGGAAVACLFLVLGFALFGKNLLNVWFIVLGVFLYARFKREPFAKHINVAFFGAALSPIFTEILFSSALPLQVSLPLAVATTLVLGFVLVPCAAHLFNAHMGHTLYNIGWVAGILGTLTVAIYKSYGFVPDPVFIWTTGNNGLLGSMLALLFIAMGLGGWWLDPKPGTSRPGSCASRGVRRPTSWTRQASAPACSTWA